MKNKLQKIAGSFERSALRAAYNITDSTGQAVIGAASIAAITALGAIGGKLADDKFGVMPDPGLGTIAGIGAGLLFGCAGIGESIGGKVKDLHNNIERRLSQMEIADRFLTRP